MSAGQASTQAAAVAKSGRLAGRVALVSAAGQGMGRAAAIAFAREGATVWATDVNAGALESLKGEPRIKTHRLDVTSNEDVAAAAQLIGTVDVLFNCAGFVHHGSLLAATEREWDAGFELNVKSMFRMTRAFLPGMLAQGRGSIINMASVASSLRGLPNRLVYGSTKAAVIGFTKAVAADYVGQGVRCNAVAPGTIDTPSLQGRINAFADPEQARRDFIARQPMKRLGTVDDMTPLFVYLASDESAFATGVVFSVDGGMMI